MNNNQGIKLELEMIAKALPPEGVSMEELEQRVLAAGNKIIRREVDGLIIGYDKKIVMKMESTND